MAKPYCEDKVMGQAQTYCGVEDMRPCPFRPASLRLAWRERYSEKSRDGAEGELLPRAVSRSPGLVYGGGGEGGTSGRKVMG